MFETVFIVVILIVCSIVNAVILGNVTVMLQSLNRKSSRFQEKLENVTDIMKNLSLNDEVKGKIKHYISYTENTFENQKEMDSFLSILSPSLKKIVTINIFKDAILENKAFKDQNEIMDIL